MDTGVLRIGRPVLANEHVRPDALVETVSLNITLNGNRLRLVKTMCVLKTLRRLPPHLRATYEVRSVMVTIILVRLEPLANEILTVTIRSSATKHSHLKNVNAGFTGKSCTLRADAAANVDIRRVRSPVIVPWKDDIGSALTDLRRREFNP